MNVGINQIDPDREAIVKLWREIGPGKSFALQSTLRGISGADPLLDLIDDLVKAPIRGDSTRLHRLIGYGFVTIEPHPELDHVVVYQVAKVEPEPDTRTLVEREQEVISQGARRERWLQDQEWEAQQRVADQAQAGDRAALVYMLQHPDVRSVLRQLVHEEVEAELQRQSAAV